jgi:hypothetical protein
VNNSQAAALNNHTGRISALESVLACEAVIPLNQFGDPGGTFGYEFNDGQTTLLTTALDATAQDDPGAVWFVVDTCATAATARAISPRSLKLRPHLPR